MKYSIIIPKLLLAVFLISCNAKTNTHTNQKLEPGYTGDDLSANASIIWDRDTKQTKFVSTLQGEWTLYGGQSVDSINFTNPLITGNGSGEFPLTIPNDKRYYFELITPTGTALLAERLLPMAGAYNLRDLGGYKTKDSSRYVKWGKIFRSDDLSTLTDTDLNYLSSIPLTCLVDFRTSIEIKVAEDKRPKSLKSIIFCPIAPGNLGINDSSSAKQVDEAMIKLYEFLVSDSASIYKYRKMLAQLQPPFSDRQLLFHCTAGKDRTGMAAAFILFALGVDEKTIMNDFLMSNDDLKEKYAKDIQDHPNLSGLFTVKKEYLESALNRIRKDNGTIENFLEKKLNVDINTFRDKYLYH
ncbi:protein-tyrosine-phosphatase [Chitinophaga silvatica]|uniref:Protein-tyrosine-phosphatase n=1 Tax=Chitinophaga silvatica TaxID=2282649 RepID=A0A3E1YHC9_9BACT|nr:tyrosine-protein phosphatase [Chitinophaga silvatica]RFS26754.1 protein-tyrosine-phosphatase [Chitinophaga silvatica]